MPQLPTYSLPQVETRALPGPRFSPVVPGAAFGGPIGQASQGWGQVLAQRASQLQMEDDQNAALMAFHQASGAMDRYLYGVNGQPGLLAKQGLDALGSTGEAKRMFSEIGNEASRGLQSEGARFRFNRYWIQRAVTAEHSISVFEAQQRMVASDQVVGAAKDQALRDVAKSPTPAVIFDTKSHIERSYRQNGRSDIEIADVFQQIDDLAANNQIRTLIRQDPLATAAALLAPDGPFSDRPLEWREVQASQAMEEFDRRSRVQLAQEEAERRAADQRERELQVQYAKEGDALLGKGQLTPQWVYANQEHLSKEDFRYFLKNAAGLGGTAKRDSELFSDLYELARKGNDVSEPARAGFVNGDLTREDYTLLLGRSEAETAIPGKSREAIRYAEISMGDDAALVSQGSRTRKANVFAALWDFIRQNPDLSRKEYLDEAKRIVGLYSIIAPDEMVTTLEPILFRIGSRLEPDIPQSIAATQQAYANGQLSDEQFQEQMILIDKWAEVLDRFAERNKEKSQ